MCNIAKEGNTPLKYAFPFGLISETKYTENTVTLK
jgi:hypothetical protein